MKTKYLYLLLIIFATTIFSAGCYTQFAERADNYSNDQDDYGYYDQEENYDSTYSADEYDRDYGYEDDADVVVNKYYLGHYPTYRRYFWGYHPSVYVGFSFGNWYYDPFYWDPFDYWNWCGSSWYYPGYYYSYYNPYYYYPNYNWSYGYNYGFKNYRERSRDTYGIRNNSGVRNSYVTRGGLTRRGSGSLDKNITTRNSSRDVLLDRNATSRNRNIEKGRIDVKRGDTRRNSAIENSKQKRDDNTVRKSPNIRKNDTRKGYESIFKNKPNDTKTSRPGNEDTRSRDVNKNTPKVKKENSGTKPRTESRNRNESRIERRTQETPKSYSPPQRSYSPPRNNTLRSSSPPRSSPPSGNTNRGGDRRR